MSNIKGFLFSWKNDLRNEQAACKYNVVFKLDFARPPRFGVIDQEPFIYTVSR